MTTPTTDPFTIIDPSMEPAAPTPVGVQTVEPSVSPALPPDPAPPTAVVVPIPTQSGPAPTPVPQGAAARKDLPDFEGVRVENSTIIVTGKVELPLDEDVLGMDDQIRLCGTFRVVGVRFSADPRTGDTIRTHVVKLHSELTIVPFDVNDANDTGIVRAR